MKKYTTLFAFLVVLSISLFGCSRCNNNTVFTSQLVESFLATYNFTMTDSLGNNILEGTFRPKNFADPEINGLYAVIKVVDNNYSSLLSRSDPFSGTLDEKNKKVFVNMNPKISDGNIFLRLDVKNDELVGTWEKSGMTGIKDKGKFKATKIL